MEVKLLSSDVLRWFSQLCRHVVYLPSLCSGRRAWENARLRARGGRYLRHARFYKSPD